MFIVAGLGNPGHEYCENRHNIGFMCIDRIHSFHFFPAWKKNFMLKYPKDNLMAYGQF